MAQPEARWLLQQDRPGADLLISEPLCCNLLGELAADLELAGGVRPGQTTALAALSLTAAVGVALLPPAAAPHHRQ